MWTYVKWTIRIVLLLLVAAFLHYTLPQHDIVRITGTYNRLTTVGTENAWAYASPDTGTAESTVTRDIRFIEAAFPDGSVIVYRNEDTGWVWPPYFKYDSSNLQAEAGNLKSLASAPIWVSMTHYGWRFPFLSIYPNAVSVKEVAGPDVRIVPWVNIIVLLTLALGVFMLRRMWMQFWERAVEPAVAGVEETWDGVEAQADAAKAQARGFFGRIGAWFGTWKKKPKP
ncbi:MAG: DUF1523 family protein [Rhodobacteraceae bacterium]|nr:DUF1523 family protein [Paracoccaceae bacterium]